MTETLLIATWNRGNNTISIVSLVLCTNTQEYFTHMTAPSIREGMNQAVLVERPQPSAGSLNTSIPPEDKTGISWTWTPNHPHWWEAAQWSWWPACKPLYFSLSPHRLSAIKGFQGTHAYRPLWICMGISAAWQTYSLLRGLAVSDILHNSSGYHSLRALSTPHRALVPA